MKNTIIYCKHLKKIGLKSFKLINTMILSFLGNVYLAALILSVHYVRDRILQYLEKMMKT